MAAAAPAAEPARDLTPAGPFAPSIQYCVTSSSTFFRGGFRKPTPPISVEHPGVRARWRPSGAGADPARRLRRDDQPLATRMIPFSFSPGDRNRRRRASPQGRSNKGVTTSRHVIALTPTERNNPLGIRTVRLRTAMCTRHPQGASRTLPDRNVEAGVGGLRTRAWWFGGRLAQSGAEMVETAAVSHHGPLAGGSDRGRYRDDRPERCPESARSASMFARL